MLNKFLLLSFFLCFIKVNVYSEYHFPPFPFSVNENLVVLMTIVETDTETMIDETETETEIGIDETIDVTEIDTEMTTDVTETDTVTEREAEAEAGTMTEIEIDVRTVTDREDINYFLRYSSSLLFLKELIQKRMNNCH